jgi:hypothetical protein
MFCGTRRRKWITRVVSWRNAPADLPILSNVTIPNLK